MELTLEEQITRLNAQVTDLTAANTDLTGQLDATRGTLRARNHGATFKELAGELGVRPNAVDSLYKLLGYDPGEADEADPDRVKALIEGGRESFDFCFNPPEPEPAKGEVKADKPPIPAVPRPASITPGRGKTPPADTKFRVTRENTSDPKWLYENRKAYAEAGKAGNLEIVD